MNTETGQIYRGDEIDAARARGEPVVEVSKRVAELMELGLNRADRRQQEREQRRAAKRGGLVR